MKKLILIVLATALLIAAPAAAADVSLNFSWNQDVDAGFAGWKFYKSTAPGVAATPENLFATISYAGSQQSEYTTTQTIVAPDGAETKLYFAATAFDTSGNQSALSNEVVATVDFKPPGAPMTLKVTVTVQQ